MERQVRYETDPDSTELLRAIEEKMNGMDDFTEIVLAYVPEAGELCFIDALRLARERDEEAARTLLIDCELQIELVQTARL